MSTPPDISHDAVGPIDVSAASVSDQDNMAYLLVERASGAALLVDAADRPDALRAMLADAAARAAERGEPAPHLESVVTTHKHWDHHRALAALADETRAAVLAGDADADALPVTVDRRLHDGDTIGLGSTELRVIALRGHTPGSVALALAVPGEAVRLFTGDSLFPGGVGNTDGDHERFTSLLADVESRLFGVYDDETVVYPGHGAATTLGAERPHLAEWRERGW
ncbi:MBL fold metallo-hydrolase [Pseudoclavibacter chungangensis]|uniref:MBL fold metallo-hydrolase n=1 Tax=Pseudoclavibacter chungangensis TaxID=587635 RepID=A0A7J5C394_9MICO|nr:MBL fold metallo-hydrolase [Pseudoclavibacter chungangensis]KAB1662238.1 MBL fold metallo-hydrolase [Pseudoclavibacter chungangensis]NYJ65443.1 glyoxylase-like metal-dependent hydrolase (beta-lactamase superfamily II) [Pseudoclavibacter chungangensis]